MTKHWSAHLASVTSSRSFAPEHRLAWSLLLLRACEKTGLVPITIRTFHRLIYFANCLAQVYDSQPPAELVMKQGWGPYYPRAQYDLDQLVMMGLIDVANVSWEVTNGGTWKAADFSVSDKGFSLALELIQDAEWFAEVDRFMIDLCSAYSNLDDDKLDSTVKEDLTYTQAGFKSGAVINFRELRRNLSARGARAFQDMAPSLAIPNRQQQLKLYMKFLEGRAA